ncbi:5-methylthioadenosine/S-adenosylhomocysteine deaminase [Vitis vinifera]|uniref:5-methylthioadenosine/S-adenosylhomocysteine deaminase n=1 Tax=Vitis vinifera TaxID=29760 RepID=A0A438HHX7_VITVI|nr:5-methylthioadenosine/S-adenosylhomocysteine deaminase [Vitis vinifera]
MLSSMPPVAEGVNLLSLSAQSQKELYEKHHDTADGRIRIWLGIRQIMNATDRLLLETRDVAKELKTGIHMHVAEISYENQVVKDTRKVDYGTVAYLEKIDLLNGNLLAAHTVWVNDTEVIIVADSMVEDLRHLFFSCPLSKDFGCGIVDAMVHLIVLIGYIWVSSTHKGKFPCEAIASFDFAAIRVLAQLILLVVEVVLEPASVGAGDSGGWLKPALACLLYFLSHCTASTPPLPFVARQSLWEAITSAAFDCFALSGCLAQFSLMMLAYGSQIGFLSRAGVKVSHCPASAMRMLGFAPIKEMLDAGICVSLGTDGAPSNNRMSIVDDMYLASLINKGREVYKLGTTDPTALPAETILKMATINGAKTVLWENEIGSLEIGKKADMIIINPFSWSMAPVHDCISSLVYSMRSENIVSVMCNGQWIMKDGKILNVNEGEVISMARKASSELLKRAGIRIPKRMNMI